MATYELSPKERKLADLYIKQHVCPKKKKKRNIFSRVFGSFGKESEEDDAHFSVSYIMSPTGIGIGVTVKCNRCGDEVDITDYDLW